MDPLDRFLDSQIFRRLAVVFGVIGGLLKVVDIYFPNINLIPITTLLLGFFCFYIGAILLRSLIYWIRNVNEIDYKYQAKRYGMGYDSFELQCIIDLDGSAKVIREVKTKAYSEISVFDTFIRIQEKDPDGKSRDVELGEIESNDKNRQLTLRTIKNQPGSGNISAKIDVYPPLKSGDILSYRISDFYLPKGLFGIDLSRQELQKRENPIDYFGWHINRPTRKFTLQIFFPAGRQPVVFRSEVRYAKAAGDISDQGPTEEAKNLKPPTLSRSGDRYVLNLEIEYPLSGLIYMIGWYPVSRNSNPIP